MLFLGVSRNDAMLGLVVIIINPSDIMSSLPTVTTLGILLNSLNKLFDFVLC